MSDYVRFYASCLVGSCSVVPSCCVPVTYFVGCFFPFTDFSDLTSFFFSGHSRTKYFERKERPMSMPVNFIVWLHRHHTQYSNTEHVLLAPSSWDELIYSTSALTHFPHPLDRCHSSASFLPHLACPPFFTKIVTFPQQHPLSICPISLCEL